LKRAKIPELRKTFASGDGGTPFAKGISAALSCAVKAGTERQPQRLMNIFEVQGNWNIAWGKLKQKFAQLTDDDRQFREGKEEELIGRIQKRTGQAKEDKERASGEYCATPDDKWVPREENAT
jgi:uncharacterized protein YjbJ (UPF0337 family)